MSFGINGPNDKPAIQKAQSMFNNGGGGGNAGYFRQRKKDTEEEKQENDIIEFSVPLKEHDFYEKNTDSIGERIKKFWFSINLFGITDKKNPDA